jgi:two-component system sensor histidine kinase CpxA
LVQGNEEQLRRAIENVLRNALRHAPADTAIDVDLRPAAAVAVSGAGTPSTANVANETGSARPTSTARVRLTVRDRGPGVPDAALPHLFTPFYRVDADRERRTGGVGLGLAIARRAVELHDGQITARNAAPGLEVEILLPSLDRQDRSPIADAASARHLH